MTLFFLTISRSEIVGGLAAGWLAGRLAGGFATALESFLGGWESFLGGWRAGWVAGRGSGGGWLGNGQRARLGHHLPDICWLVLAVGSLRPDTPWTLNRHGFTLPNVTSRITP